MTAPANPLYLSCLLLNPRSRQVRSELAHPYEMHRTLMRAFPNVTADGQPAARERFGVLFRAETAETDDRRGVPKLLVQSLVRPDWSFLDGLHDYLYGGAEVARVSCKDIMPAYQKLERGQILRFRLRANPTKRIAKQDDPMKGKRVELRGEQEQVDWLIRKGKERGEGLTGGFELVMKEVANGGTRLVPRINACTEGKQKGRKMNEAGGRVATHLAVLFDGLLRVTDKDALVETLIRGIGSGKAFGFGLLSVAPLRTDSGDGGHTPQALKPPEAGESRKEV